MAPDCVLMKRRLAAHRVNVPGLRENSLKGLVTLCRLDIAFLEIDTRATGDGHLVVFHDAFLRSDTGRKVWLARTPLAEVQESTQQEEPIATLEAALTAFGEHSRPSSQLCIDVKDFGYEQQHLAAIRKHDVEQRTILISWIPQSLQRFADLGFAGPLVLTYWNLLAFGGAGRLAERALGALRLPLGNALYLGRDQAGAPLPAHFAHHEHKLIAGTLPRHLEQLLQRSAGGICVRHELYGAGLRQYAQQAGLAFWLYTAKTAEQFIQMASLPQVNVVLCDDAQGVLRKLG
jgi:glycerophosphoryl diester phosphodiesterase